MKHAASLAVTLLIAVSFGCSSERSKPRPDPAPDSGQVLSDAMVPSDASLQDSGDLPPAEDAEVDESTDAGQLDASDPPTDAMVQDAATPDATDPVDAAEPIDAAEPQDAEPDAEIECPEGYESDGTACQDIDECETETDDCDPYAWCTNTLGDYTCECFEGALGDGYDCTDVDQCMEETDACDPNAVCDNFFGLYDCTCLDGFVGDGFSCGNVDECTLQTDECDDNARCIDEIGAYDCECHDGYDGDGFSCTAINDCELGSATCDSLTECVDIGVGYECTPCPEGYGGTGGTACIPQLTDLVPSVGRLDPVFDPSTLGYALTTGLEAASFHVTPSAPDGVVIRVDGVAVASATASPSVALPAIGAQATMSVSLSAPNGQTRAYAVDVERNYRQTTYIKATNPGAYDGFSEVLAVDDDLMVIGTAFEDSAAIGVNGVQANEGATDSGAAYVLRRIDGAWQHEAYLKASNAQGSNNGSGVLADYFGYDVAASGDRVVVGAIYEDSAATGVNGNQADNSAQSSGAAYVFRFNGTAWQQEAYLKASNTGSGDAFGYAVAISGDTIVVSAHLEDGSVGGINPAGSDNSAINSGAAYVYRYNGAEWQLEATLKPRYPDAQDRFGMSVAIDGDVVLISSFGEDGGDGGVNGDEQDDSVSGAGAAYVFRRVAGVWQQEAYLKAGMPDTTTVADGTGFGFIGDSFGFSVALRGDVALIGAPYEASGASGVNGDQADESELGAGAAYVFRYDGANWQPEAYLKASHPEGLSAADPTAGTLLDADRFGWEVALGEDLIAIGAPGEDSAARRVNGDELDNSAPGSGAVYVFRREAGAWSQTAYLKSNNGGGPATSLESSGDGFGDYVGISGQSVVAGAHGEDSSQSGVHADGSPDNSLAFSGACYVFE